MKSNEIRRAVIMNHLAQQCTVFTHGVSVTISFNYPVNILGAVNSEAQHC